MSTASDVPLYDKDYVIINSKGEFLSHEDGRIVIYGDVMVATEDFKNLKDCKMWSCTYLSAKNRKILRKNIRKYGNGVL